MSATDPTHSPGADPQWLQWRQWQESPQFRTRRARKRRRLAIFFLLYGASSAVLSVYGFSAEHGASAGVFFAVTTVVAVWLGIQNLRLLRQSR